MKDIAGLILAAFFLLNSSARGHHGSVSEEHMTLEAPFAFPEPSSTSEKSLPSLDLISEEESSSEEFAEPFAADPDERITFWLFSQENPVTPIQVRNDSESFNGSTFDSSRPTMVLVHGFLESMNFSNIVELRENWVKNYNDNVIVVNYINFNGAGDIYDFYQNVGEVVCNFISNAIETQGLRPEDTHIVAHSVGCHVAGEAGKCLKRNKHLVSQITGLDPANWNNLPSDTTMDILRPGDAQTVDCIHTSTSFGINNPICTCNFYPNGGKDQPGCNDPIGLCNHLSSITYYINTMTEPEKYPGYRCNRFDGSVPVDCDPSKTAFMGVKADTNCDLGTVYFVPIEESPST